MEKEKLKLSIYSGHKLALLVSDTVTAGKKLGVKPEDIVEILVNTMKVAGDYGSTIEESMSACGHNDKEERRAKKYKDFIKEVDGLVDNFNEEYGK